MDVLIAGGTGFLGRALCADLLAGGHRVWVLSRRPRQAQAMLGGAITVLPWDPARVTPDQPWVQQTGQVQAVVNLSGENVAGHGRLPRRWTPAFKAALRSSRLESTRAVVQGMALAPPERRPRVLVNASAIGYYGNRGDEQLTEASARGHDFFADLCAEWEEAAAEAEPLGLRVVRLRTGIVLARGGLASDLLILASRLGAGGPLGSGRQWWSWIHRDDVVGLMRHALETDAVRGPLNVVAPDPRPMADFPRVLGRLLRRPDVLPAPAFALRLVFGEVADALLLNSQRVLPAQATQTGYAFRFADLEDAFRAILRSSRAGV